MVFILFSPLWAPHYLYALCSCKYTWFYTWFDCLNYQVLAPQPDLLASFLIVGLNWLNQIENSWWPKRKRKEGRRERERKGETVKLILVTHTLTPEMGMAIQSSILAWRIPWKDNPMDRGAWQDTVHGIVESRTWLSDSLTHTHTHPHTHTHTHVCVCECTHALKGLSRVFSSTTIRKYQFYHICMWLLEKP